MTDLLTSLSTGQSACETKLTVNFTQGYLTGILFFSLKFALFKRQACPQVLESYLRFPSYDCIYPTRFWYFQSLISGLPDFPPK